MSKIKKISSFFWSNPHHQSTISCFGARVDGKIKLSKFYVEMRLKRSLRPLRLLRLLRSLRPLRFFMPRNHSVCKVHAVLSFLEAKEAVEVVEASDIIMLVEVIEATEVFRTTQSLQINDIKARIAIFWCFEKEIFLKKILKFQWNFALSQNWGCGGQGGYFWPNQRIITQMPPTQDSQNTFKPSLTCIFVSARTRYIMSIPNGRPCTFPPSVLFFSLMQKCKCYCIWHSFFLKDTIGLDFFEVAKVKSTCPKTNCCERRQLHSYTCLNVGPKHYLMQFYNERMYILGIPDNNSSLGLFPPLNSFRDNNSIYDAKDCNFTQIITASKIF